MTIKSYCFWDTFVAVLNTLITPLSENRTSSHDTKPETKSWFPFLMVAGWNTNRTSSRSDRSTGGRFGVWGIWRGDFIVWGSVRRLQRGLAISEER